MLNSVQGGGLFNSLINKLPFELHLPGYQFCGPGTKLSRRLERGDQGINPLDKACKEHDIAYSQYKDIHNRHISDKILEDKAWERVKDKNSSTGEKINAWLVTTGMKTKRKLGLGIEQRKRRKRRRQQRRQVAFSSNILKPIKSTLRNITFSDNEKDLFNKVKLALNVGKSAVKKIGGRKNIRTPRIIPIPNAAEKVGGFLPFLVPLFAGLSAAGALASGVSNVVKAIKDTKAANRRLKEQERHNKTMESITIGKSGGGLYLQPYRKGLGLFLNDKTKKKNFLKNR